MLRRLVLFVPALVLAIAAGATPVLSQNFGNSPLFFSDLVEGEGVTVDGVAFSANLDRPAPGPTALAQIHIVVGGIHYTTNPGAVVPVQGPEVFGGAPIVRINDGPLLANGTTPARLFCTFADGSAAGTGGVDNFDVIILNSGGGIIFSGGGNVVTGRIDVQGAPPSP